MGVAPAFTQPASAKTATERPAIGAHNPISLEHRDSSSTGAAVLGTAKHVKNFGGAGI